MRTNGKITHWNTEKGYGFITPNSGGKQVFVHIRAFQNKFWQPSINQDVTFELSTDQQGRPCAARVARAGEELQRETAHGGLRHSKTRRGGSRQHEARRGGSPWRIVNAVGFLLVLSFLGLFVYPRVRESLLQPEVTPTPLASPYQGPLPEFQCDGRTRCTQMTSCEEAFFFIEHCPGAEMDGDVDGIPCEGQWCG